MHRFVCVCSLFVLACVRICLFFVTYSRVCVNPSVVLALYMSLCTCVCVCVDMWSCKYVVHVKAVVVITFFHIQHNSVYALDFISAESM